MEPCPCSSWPRNFTTDGPDRVRGLKVLREHTPPDLPYTVYECQCEGCGARWEVLYEPFFYHYPGYTWRKLPGSP